MSPAGRSGSFSNAEHRRRRGATGTDRIFDGYPDVALEMVATRTFDGRLQLLEYVPTVLTGPPGVDGTSGSDPARPSRR
jgi:hypothetical protein